MADRKISDLTALTTPAAGDFLPIVDISEAAAASKNKRITIEELFRGVPLGTAAAPSIAIEGNENTGVFSPGANQLAVATNGTGRLFINSTGLVGIGTGAPASVLHTVAAASFDPTNNSDFTGVGLFLQSPAGIAGDGNFGSALAWSRPTDNSRFKTAIAPVQEGSDQDRQGLAFFTANGVATIVAPEERLRISNAGRVGIGTTSPATTLDVNGDVTITDKIIHGGDTNTAIRFPATDTVSVETAGSERVRIDSSNRLLVGTSSDSGGALFQVNGDRIRVGTAKTPATSGATGTTGEIAWDADYIYVCTATNTWKRSAIATW